MLISSRESAAIAFAFACIFTLGSLSNGLILLTYLRGRKTIHLQPRDILIISLAIGDFVQALFACPLAFTSAIAREWVWGDIGCSWYAFITTWVGLASIVQLATFAIERYVTLRSPTPNMITTSRAVQFLVASWLLTFIVSCLPLFGWSAYVKEGLGLHCSIYWEERSMENMTYCLFLLLFFFVAPVGAIVISNMKILTIVHHIYTNANRMWGPEAQATKQSYVAQVKTAKQLIAMILTFLVAWTPYSIMSCLQLAFNTNIPLGSREYPSMLAKTAILANPVIYFFTYRSLRNRAVSMIKCQSQNAVVPTSSFQ